MAAHRVTTRHLDGFRFETTFDAAPGVRLVVDEPPPLGAGAGPNAADLLASAAANCLAASLLLCLRKGRVAVHGLSSSAVARVTRNDAGRLRVAGIDVTLRPEVESEADAALARCASIFEDYCTVGASIRPAIPVEVAIEPVVRAMLPA